MSANGNMPVIGPLGTPSINAPTGVLMAAFTLVAVLAALAATRLIHQPRSTSFRVFAVMCLVTTLLRIVVVTFETRVTVFAGDAPLLQRDNPASWVMNWLLMRATTLVEASAYLALGYMWRDAIAAAHISTRAPRIVRAMLLALVFVTLLILAATLAAMWMPPNVYASVTEGVVATYFFALGAMFATMAVELRNILLPISATSTARRDTWCACCRRARVAAAGHSAEAKIQQVLMVAGTIVFAALARVVSSTFYLVADLVSTPMQGESQEELIAWSTCVTVFDVVPMVLLLLVTTREPYRSHLLCVPLWRGASRTRRQCCAAVAGRTPTAAVRPYRLQPNASDDMKVPLAVSSGTVDELRGTPTATATATAEHAGSGLSLDAASSHGVSWLGAEGYSSLMLARSATLSSMPPLTSEPTAGTLVAADMLEAL